MADAESHEQTDFARRAFLFAERADGEERHEMNRYPARVTLGVLSALALILWFSASSVPGWMYVAIVVAALPIAFVAGAKQKRMERAMMRSWYRAWRAKRERGPRPSG